MTDNRKALIEYRLTQAKDSLKDFLKSDRWQQSLFRVSPRTRRLSNCSGNSHYNENNPCNIRLKTMPMWEKE